MDDILEMVRKNFELVNEYASSFSRPSYRIVFDGRSDGYQSYYYKGKLHNSNDLRIWPSETLILQNLNKDSILPFEIFSDVNPSSAKFYEDIDPLLPLAEAAKIILNRVIEANKAMNSVDTREEESVVVVSSPEPVKVKGKRRKGLSDGS